MAYFWGASGVAAVQAVADTLTLLLALPLIRGIMCKIRQAEEQQAAGGEAAEVRL